MCKQCEKNKRRTPRSEYCNKCIKERKRLSDKRYRQENKEQIKKQKKRAYHSGKTYKCAYCGGNFVRKVYGETPKYCNRKCFELHSRETRMGENNPAWKGGDYVYDVIHREVKKAKGKAKRCMNREEKILDFECSKKSKKFEWANISGEYKRDVNDFMSLCVYCHRVYDGNEPWRFSPYKKNEKK